MIDTRKYSPRANLPPAPPTVLNRPVLEPKTKLIMKNAIFSLSLWILLASSLNSCATLFGPKTHPLSLSSDPYPAEVYVDGQLMGETPVTFFLKADKPYEIEFCKEGYKPARRYVGTAVGNEWLILDILGGLIPVIVDASTGNWNYLEPDRFHVVLEKEEEAQ